MNKIKQLLFGSLISLLAFNAHALLMVDGSFDMGAGAYLLDAGGDVTNDASLAVAIDFNRGNFRVLAANGDFSGNRGNIGRIKDFTFESFSGPIVDFWTMDGFSFELTGVARGATNDVETFLVLNGTGIISAAGFADTQANWRYSSNTTGNGAFSWSATSGAQAVPEPAVLALLSVGLIGFGLRKKL